MSLAGTNYFGVLLAAIAGFIFGAVYYGVFSKPWIRAGRIPPDLARPGPAVLAVTFVSELIMAFVLAGVIGHHGAGQVTPWNGIVWSFSLWIGFIVTTMAVNHRYQGYGWSLTLIDSGHWLGVALIMGVIIGWFGV